MTVEKCLNVVPKNVPIFSLKVPNVIDKCK